MTEGFRENHRASDQGGMQGGRHGSRHDIGIYGRVDAVRCVSAFDRILGRSNQSNRQHNTGFVRQVEHLLEPGHLHRTEYAGK